MRLSSSRPSLSRLKYTSGVCGSIRTSPASLPSYPPPVLTDEEADEIRRKLAEGWRGPVLLTWLEQLLQDRKERRQREQEREPSQRSPET
jgi:hypothetical protein